MNKNMRFILFVFISFSLLACSLGNHYCTGQGRDTNPNGNPDCGNSKNQNAVTLAITHSEYCCCPIG